MACSINFSMTFQTEILSTATSDFLKQMTIFKSFNSIFKVDCCLMENSKIVSENTAPKPCNATGKLVHIHCYLTFKVLKKSRQQNLRLQSLQKKCAFQTLSY